jgi:phosphate transport system permease protein
MWGTNIFLTPPIEELKEEKITSFLKVAKRIFGPILRRAPPPMIRAANNLALFAEMKWASVSAGLASIRRQPEVIVFFLCAASSIGIVLFIVSTLILEGYPAIMNWFLHGFGMNWIPPFPGSTEQQQEFGIVPYIFSTLYVGAGSIVIATALGIPCAIYLAEFAMPQVRNVIKTSLEVLTGLPSVVIGLFGFVFIVGITHEYFGAGISVLAAWIVLAIMSLPHIASISDDAMRAVPNSYKEASLAMGATRWQTTVHVVMPAAKSGILTSLILALGNAIGETMAVLMVIGRVNTPPITLDPRVSSNVMTALIANNYGDMTPLYSPAGWQALVGVGFILFLMVGIMNIATKRILKGMS